MKWFSYGILAIFLSSCSLISEAKLKEGDCDVCIKFLTKFDKKLTDRSSPDAIKKELLSFCEVSKGKDHRFCYYIGAVENAATMILNVVTEPLLHFVPPEKICEKLKTKDSQICELQYEQKINVENVDLKKMRVKQLRKILQSWEEECPGCIEKNDFVDRINELKHKHKEEL